MKGEHLRNMTPEERKANLAKAKEARAAKIEAGKYLMQDFEEYPLWKDLASKAGLRLPSYYIPATEVKYIKKALKKLGIEPKEWLEVEGFTKLNQFGKVNPTWPCYAHVGLLLEYWDENN